MDKEVTNIAPANYICYKLTKVMRTVQRYYESRLSSYDITPVQFFVLSVLWENDGMKFKDLAKSLKMDGSTLTGILDRMERQDLLRRGDDPQDRRSLLIFLTEKAKKNGSEIISLGKELDQEIRDKFPKDDFAIFVKVLDDISKTIK